MSKPRIVIEDVSIKLSVLRKLPSNSTVLAVYDGVHDMDNKQHRALKVHHNPGMLLGGPSTSWFELETGRYISEV